MAIDRLIPLVTEDTPSLADRAYGALREAIVDGTLDGGTKLSERSLALALGVSPQPVREALRRLEIEGLAETRPRSGTYVASFTEDRLIEMGRIRAALEGLAASIAAVRRTPEDIAALERCLDVVALRSAEGDDRRLAAVNDVLHETIHTITGNPVLIRSLKAMKAYYHISSRRILVRPAQHGQSLEEHTAIVRAIIAGRAREAEKLMQNHTLRNLRVAFPAADI